MTVSQIIAIVGTSASNDIPMLSSADTAAEMMLGLKGGVLIDYDKNDCFNAIDRIAADGGASPEEQERALKEIGEAMKGAGSQHWDAGGLACDLWTPKVCAAYYLGLAIGLRLAAMKASQ